MELELGPLAQHHRRRRALIDGIAAELGGRVMPDAEVLEVAPEADVVHVRYRQGGAERELRARHAIVARRPSTPRV